MGVILGQRVRGSIKAVRAVRNTRLFLMETRLAADVGVVFSSPALKFAIREVLVESGSKTPELRGKSGLISQPLNDYQSDRKFDCRS